MEATSAICPPLIQLLYGALGTGASCHSPQKEESDMKCQTALNQATAFH